MWPPPWRPDPPGLGRAPEGTMPQTDFTLHAVTVPSFLQTLRAAQGVLERGLAHCGETGLDPGELVETRLAADMLPLRFQVISVAHHSLGALQAVTAKV